MDGPLPDASKPATEHMRIGVLALTSLSTIFAKSNSFSLLKPAPKTVVTNRSQALGEKERNFRGHSQTTLTVRGKVRYQMSTLLNKNHRFYQAKLLTRGEVQKSVNVVCE